MFISNVALAAPDLLAKLAEYNVHHPLDKRIRPYDHHH